MLYYMVHINVSWCLSCGQVFVSKVTFRLVHVAMPSAQDFTFLLTLILREERTIL